MVYFDGFVQKGDWNYERWDGYETDGLMKYGKEFMDSAGDEPFLLFLSPHQPHSHPSPLRLRPITTAYPTLTLPSNVPEHIRETSLDMYRHYLAMILAVDDMLGNLLAYLDDKGLADNTIVMFASDHGTQGGSQGVNPWSKKPLRRLYSHTGDHSVSGHCSRRRSPRQHHLHGGLVSNALRLAGIPVPAALRARTKPRPFSAVTTATKPRLS